MDQPVKTPRPYHSPKHEAMRQATRQSVIAAARRLFTERGYAGSSIEAIAEAAGVAVPTVYAAFGNKRSILRAMIAASADEERPRPVAERMREQAAGVADAATRAEKMMRLIVFLISQTAEVLRVIRGAAAVDPEIQSLLDEVYERIHMDCQTAARLAIGTSSDDARTWHLADVTFAFATPDLFDLLTGKCGWSVAEYERWAIQTVTAALPARDETPGRLKLRKQNNPPPAPPGRSAATGPR